MDKEHENKGKAAPRAQARNPQNTQAQTREDRLKKALKANMARRKAQARARASGDAAAPKSSDKEA
ncbi:MAG: hypothetical protein AAGI03_08570 [Pseudomonadota bacterium]